MSSMAESTDALNAPGRFVHGVDLALMRWLSERFPAPPVGASRKPPTRSWASVLVHAGVGLGVVIAMTFVGSAMGNPNASTSFGFLVLALVIGPLSLRVPRQRLGIFPVSALAFFGIGWYMSSFQLGNGLATLLLYIAFIASTARPTPDVTRVQWAGQGPLVFGEAGKVGKAVERFGNAALIGAEGEKKTADLLQYLAQIPGVLVYHGLRFPYSRNGDVDHAVVYGDRVWLIDTKQYKGGEYTLTSDADGSIYISSSERQYRTHMDNAVKSFQNMMPEGVQVDCIIGVHGKGIRIAPNTGFSIPARNKRKMAKCTIELMDPQYMMVMLGERIAAEARNAPVAPRPMTVEVLNRYLMTV